VAEAAAEIQDAATLVDAVVAAPQPAAEATVEPVVEPAAKPRRSRARKQPEPGVQTVVAEPAPSEVAAPQVAEAQVVLPPTEDNGGEPGAARRTRRTPKPKGDQGAAPQAQPARSMPDAIGQAPRRRTRKPKEVTE
jgi:hypothetical protein